MKKEQKNSPNLRFKGFTEDWELCKLSTEFEKVNERNDGSLGKEHWISVAKMYFQNPDKVQSNNIDTRTYVMRTGDIAFEGHPNKEFKFGRFVANDIGTGVVSELFPIYRHKQEYDNYYWKNAIQIERVMGPIFAKSITSSGNSSNKLDPNHFLRQQVFIPKLEEQSKIGLFLKKIDTTIALHQRKLEQLKDLKKAYLQAMFPGKDERVPKLRFADFEEEWELRKIKDLGEIQTGNTPSTQIEDNYSNDGTLWVTPTDIDSLIIRDTAKKLSDVGLSRARIAKPGSILITSIASIGKNSLTLTDVGFNQQINSLTPSVDNDSYFLLTQSEKWSKEMRQKAASGTMQIVNKTEFSNITTNTPNLKEQQKIGIFFKKLDQSITLYKNKLNQLKALKKAYLQNMFI
ncbi:restriction endonuclease subunit S [Enterococcus faecalis]|uniref:restriction endonuclease subunit S n=1 Tax=Enterococcus faecalis TaxID=1351 RepID=UPI003F8F4CC6